MSANRQCLNQTAHANLGSVLSVDLIRTFSCVAHHFIVVLGIDQAILMNTQHTFSRRNKENIHITKTRLFKYIENFT